MKTIRTTVGVSPKKPPLTEALFLEILGGHSVIRKIPPNTQIGLYELIRQGIPGQSFVSVSKFLGMPQDALAQAMGIPSRTMYRRLQENGRLDASETEKLVRIAKTAAAAAETLQNLEKGREWMKRPNRALGGKRPIDLLDNEAGSVLVADVLGRIREGIFE